MFASGRSHKMLTVLDEFKRQASDVKVRNKMGTDDFLEVTYDQNENSQRNHLGQAAWADFTGTAFTHSSTPMISPASLRRTILP